MKKLALSLALLLPLSGMTAVDTSCNRPGSDNVVLEIDSQRGRFEFKSPGTMIQYADTQFRRVTQLGGGAIFQWINQSGVWGNGFSLEILQVTYNKEHKPEKADFVLTLDGDETKYELNCKEIIE